MWSEQQRSEFERSGVLVLREAVDPRAAASMRKLIWNYLAKRGIRPDHSGAECTVLPSKMRGAVKGQSFDGFWGESVRYAIDAILGVDQWKLPADAGQLLSMPYPERCPAGELIEDTHWKLPSKVWHLDYQAPGWLRSPPGVQVFVFLDHVEPRAGGTLGILGSHTLVDRVRRNEGPEFAGRSADVRRELRQQVPWFAELCSTRPEEDRIARFMDRSSDHDGVPLRVVEFVGAPGDVVVMHPWIVHAPSRNYGTRPRMVLTERIRACRPPNPN